MMGLEDIEPALSSNSLELEEDDPDYHLRFNNSINGGMIYLATYFEFNCSFDGHSDSTHYLRCLDAWI